MNGLRILAIGLLLSGPLLADPAIEVQQAWIREAPPTSRVLAGYLTIINPGNVPAEITAVSSPDFSSAELHRTRVEDGVASMEAVSSITVPANDQVRLEPGGMHLMLFGPQRPLKSGDRVRLEVKQSGGTIIDVEARVTRDTGDNDAHHHHHHHHEH